MKQRLSVILTAALLLSFVTITAFAVSPGNRGNYADLNNDGICDNAPAEQDRPQDGTGKQNGKGAGCGMGMNFVDFDDDGICDNAPAEQDRPQNGTGKQNGKGAGCGMGMSKGNNRK